MCTKSKKKLLSAFRNFENHYFRQLSHLLFWIDIQLLFCMNLYILFIYCTIIHLYITRWRANSDNRQRRLATTLNFWTLSRTSPVERVLAQPRPRRWHAPRRRVPPLRLLIGRGSSEACYERHKWHERCARHERHEHHEWYIYILIHL